jgi:dihydrofolate reductase
MELVLIVARARNGVIGNAGAMPWHIPADLKRFKAITVGKPVIMGRKTYDSIGKPLPGRHNIVLTRDTGWQRRGRDRGTQPCRSHRRRRT